MIRAVLRQSARAGLVLFHVVLLWQRIADASLLDPAVLAKYLGAVALLGGAFVAQRYAPERFRGRRAVLVFWLLVLLLHAFAPAATEARALDSELAAVVQLGVVVPVALAAAHLLVTPMLQGLHATFASREVVAAPVRAGISRSRSSRAPPVR